MTTSTTPAAQPELLPCPFCNARGEEMGLCRGWFVRCYACHVETVHADSREEAIAAWNRRPAAQPAGAQPLMEITYEPFCRAFWHSNCTAQRHSPPMKIVEHEKGKRSLMECTACNQRGWYEVGWVGLARVEPVAATPTAPQCRRCADDPEQCPHLIPRGAVCPEISRADRCARPGCNKQTAGPVLAFCKGHSGPPVPFA